MLPFSAPCAVRSGSSTPQTVLLLSGVGVALPRKPEQWCLWLPLSRRFVDMDRNLPIVAPGALRFLRAVATALPRSHIHMRSIYGIDANVGEPLSFRTLIAVRLGNVGELLDPVQVGFGSRTFFHANIRSDASLLEPSQKLTVPIGRVGGNRLWKVPASFR